MQPAVQMILLRVAPICGDVPVKLTTSSRAGTHDVTLCPQMQLQLPFLLSHLVLSPVRETDAAPLAAVVRQPLAGDGWSGAGLTAGE